MERETKQNGARVNRLDHIGIAVNHIDTALSLYQNLLGLDMKEIEEVDSEQVRTARLDAGNVNIELLEPLGDDGPIKQFLEKHGPGIHHICLEVDDLGSALRSFREAGYNPVYNENRKGIENTRVNFLHPGDTDGVLVELREPGTRSES